MNHIGLILASVMLNCAAQICMKHGMLSIGEIGGGLHGFMMMIPRMVGSIALWISIFCYALSMVLWLVVLSRVDVSFAYPFNGVGYAVSAAAGYFLFHEAVTPARLLGIAVVCAGVFIIARS